MSRFPNSMKSVLLIGTLLISARLSAAEKNDGATRTRVLASVVDPQTIAVGYVDVARIDVPAVADKLAAWTQLSKEMLDEPQATGKKFVEEFQKQGGTDIYVVLSLADLPRDWPVLAIPLGPQSKVGELEKLLTRALPGRKAKQVGDVLIIGMPQSLTRFDGKAAEARPALVAAFAAAKDAPVQLHVDFSAEQRRVLKETLTAPTADFGVEPGPIVANDLRWASFTADGAGLSNWTVSAQANDSAGAARLQSLVQASVGALVKLPVQPVHGVLIGQLAALLKPTVIGDRLSVTLNEENKGTSIVASFLIPKIKESYEYTQRRQSMHNLKHFGLAMHNYHEVYSHFPPAALRDAKGTPLLSWRVLLLPYLDPKLYKEFHLDEPWDSPHNKKLIGRMPDVFRSNAARLKPGYTTYLVPVGKGTIFEGPNGMSIRGLGDGTANTIMVVDAADESAVIWTKPDDWQFDPQHPVRGLIGHHGKGLLVGLADGSALFVNESTKNIQAMFTADAGDSWGN